MKAMILAAGFGTRLGELGLALPKPLYPVCNVPLIRWAVSWLVGHEIRAIVVNLHHRGELISDELGDGGDLGARITYSVEEGEILGTGGGVKRVLDFFGGETFVVMNGKIVVDLDLHAALDHHRATGARATMVLKPDPDAARWGAIGVDPAGRLRRFLGEPAPDAPAGDGPAGDVPAEDVPAGDGPVVDHMFTGIHILEPDFVQTLPDRPCCIVRAGYRPGFEAGLRLAGYVHDGYFWDHSTPSRFLEGNLNGVHGEAHVHPDARVHDTALVGPGARIAANARVGPEAVIGPDARVAQGVSVARAVVCAGARVDADVEGAVVAPDGSCTQVDLDDAGPRTGPALKK
jgi:NDP-sugar pyrophosphorylase family protein